MNRFGTILALLMAICQLAMAQETSVDRSYMQHATIAYEGSGRILVTANSPRPLLQALTALNREYGWVVDYEAGPYNSRQMVRYSGNHYRLIGGSFKAELPEPRTGTEAEETSILQQFVDQYDNSTGRIVGSKARLVHSSLSARYNVISQSGGTPILDTPIRLPKAERSIESVVHEICTLVGRARGITFVQGGLADSSLAMTRVTLGGPQPLPARRYLVEALDQTSYEKTYVVDYSPSMNEFVIGIQTAVRVVKSVTGVTSFIPIPRSPAGSK